MSTYTKMSRRDYVQEGLCPTFLWKLCTLQVQNGQVGLYRIFSFVGLNKVYTNMSVYLELFHLQSYNHYIVGENLIKFLNQNFRTQMQVSK